MIKLVIKRDGTYQEYNKKKIADAIFKAAVACGGSNFKRSLELADEVEQLLIKRYTNETPTVEKIQDIVEYVLIENRHSRTAKAYILYREKRSASREYNSLVGATISMFDCYIQGADWAVKENANQQHSVAGLNNYIREEFTKHYWLNEVYPIEVKDAHINGDIHVHDLGWFGTYCVGWDLYQILEMGFTGVPGKVSSSPAKHFRSFLGQVVNATFTLQGEAAGAQAWSSFDTYCAPFIRYDNLDYKSVKQCIQEFVFNMNVPTRVGFHCPFSNITLDLKVPALLKDRPVLRGGVPQEETYGMFQAEMDMLNKAFCEVMSEGDSKGRIFTFPIPTINITKETDWNSPVMNAVMDMTAKFGIPYFANYINSDLSPEDAVSMCCRLRLDVSQLRKRGAGLFGSNPLTGSIGVVTINLPRLGYTCKTEEEFFAQLDRLCNVAKTSLEIKRKIVEDQTERGLYPYSSFYLQSVKNRSGAYWANHFNTIGIVGMNECLQNFMKTDLTSKQGQEFAIKVMNHLRGKMIEFQMETGNQYNLEATPAEGTAPRLARIDKKKFPEIVVCSDTEPYYTNSTQLPVQYSDDIFEVIKLQDELQSLYTGGTVLHLYLGERVDDGQTCKRLIQKIFNNSKMPYVSITPTFSVCQEHGYIRGEHFTCPQCGAENEVWSRVVGYFRPVGNFNKSKQIEYMERKKFVIRPEQLDELENIEAAKKVTKTGKPAKAIAEVV
ncbi:MAG: ribonucleoside triphosphate reductase [Firmicutes bacterium]|nr:ribonucleoside triphosphate reductase [Bacillota bacterium]